MIEGPRNRERVLERPGQTVDVAQDARAEVSQVEVELSAAALLQDEKKEAPPEQEPLVVDDQPGVAEIGKLAKP